MIVLLSDPRVHAVPVRETGEPLVRLGEEFGSARALVRRSLADRLRAARTDLPRGIGIRVQEGHRSPLDQAGIIRDYSARLRRIHPAIDADRLRTLTSRYVSPLEVAPHVAGAAVDLTLVDADGLDLDLGTPIDATPEQSDGGCYFAATGIGDVAVWNRALLGNALAPAGFVNYPTEWWHWSYGDRYWALMTSAPAALFGPVDALEVVA